jgi:hypothetical protein
MILAGLLFGATWIGTARVEMMAWEGGGEHPYTTQFELRYRESAESPLRDSKGRIIGRRLRLVPEVITLKATHEVRGLLNCQGSGEESVANGPEGELIVPVQGADLTDLIGFNVPATGAYQLVLPRASAAYACGHNNRNRNNRQAGIGRGLLRPDLDAPDASPRFVEKDVARMRGTYDYHRARSADGSQQHLVTKEFHVTWDLRRGAGE